MNLLAQPKIKVSDQKLKEAIDRDANPAQKWAKETRAKSPSIKGKRINQLFRFFTNLDDASLHSIAIRKELLLK